MVVMSGTIIAKLFCDSPSFPLLLVIFMTSCLSISSGSLAENAKIPRDESATYPETTIPQGTLRGINMFTHYKRMIYGFMGVPYAQPPVGDLRFKAPIPPEVWNGTFDASTEAVPCPQFNGQGQIVGDEDCLYLNVFTPQAIGKTNCSFITTQLSENGNTTLLPVMVFTIGGAFQTENNSIVRYGPDFLLEKDVVLVIPNFRVGLLGYLSTGDEVSPGNYGLKDMVRVLEWVQVSIQYFGGDPNAVTLFGQSSGGMSVHLLALSNFTDGLIHKYITESGSALTNLVNRPKEVYAKRAIQLGEYLGCPTNTSTLLVNCLRGFNVSHLLETRSLFHVWQTYPSIVWHPISEPDIEGALLIDTPANLFAAGKIRDLPWISCVTRDEGLVETVKFYDDPDLFEDFLDNIDIALPHILLYEGAVDDVTSYTATLKSYYLNDLTAKRSLLLANFTKLVGDGIFVYPVYKALQQQLVLAENPQYLFSFEFRGTFSFMYYYSKGPAQLYTSVPHGDDLIYLYKTHDPRFGTPDQEYTQTDLITVHTMVQLWTSFAETGTPTMVDSDSTDIWTAYSSLNNYLRIGNGSDAAVEMKYDLSIERMKFWEELTAFT